MMLRRPLQDDAIAVVGAGIIGCAIAQALAAQGRQVLLLDRAGPAIAGASFGNVGHIATEQVETLPSKRLLLGFWRQLFAFDGALDIPLHRVMSLSPWLARFAVASLIQRDVAVKMRAGVGVMQRSHRGKTRFQLLAHLRFARQTRKRQMFRVRAADYIDEPCIVTAHHRVDPQDAAPSEGGVEDVVAPGE